MVVPVWPTRALGGALRTPTKTGARAAVGLLASVALLAGCANASGEQSGAEAQKEKEALYVNGFVGDAAESGGEPQDGGTLTVGEYGEARSLDPTKTIPNGAVGGNPLAAVYDTLMRYDVTTGEVVPQLAESLTSDDHKVWTLTLREGVAFSDGTPLDAAAVLGSLDYYMKNAGFNTQILAENIADMKPGGEREVTFTLRRAWPAFPSVFASGPGMVMAPAAYKDPAAFEPIGAGPFVLDSYKPAEELLLEANEDYWDGAPHLDGLRFVFLASDQARLESLAAGEIDTAYLRSPEVVETARSRGYDGAMSVTGGGSTLQVNNAEDRPGGDLRVRQAIDAAIDREVWMERTNGDHGLPTASLVPDLWSTYRDVDTDSYDPEKAKELLDAAKADGYDGKLEYLGQSDQASQAAAVAVQAMLEKVGFTVEKNLVRSVTDQTTKVYVERDFDIATGALSLGEEDLFGRLSSNLSATSPSNAARYSDKEMDGLVADLQAADTTEEKAEALAAINERWQETVPSLVLASGAVFYPWGEDVHGLVPSAESIVLFQDAWKG
jgi:peptide/nickel transport system substrate-binding protein